MSKSEKLARELASLRLRYSDQDFDAAIKILASGELFGRAIEAVGHIRQKAFAKGSPRSTKSSSGVEMATKSLLGRLELDAGVRQLAERILKHELLKSSSALRAFAETLDLRLPKKLPSRLIVTQRVSMKLLSFPLERRRDFIHQAESMDKEVSSLQLWSDVIVQQAGKSS